MEKNLIQQINGFRIVQDWDTISRQIRTRFPLLTDEDLFFEPGMEEELLDRLMNTLNRPRQEIINFINRYQGPRFSGSSLR
jgi:hypothetical protein